LVRGILGKKPGFWGGYQELSVGSEKETRFLLLGQRNRVSGVGIRSYLWEAKKKPGFCCWGKETGFLGWVSGVVCGKRERNPVSGVRFLLLLN